MADKSEIAQPPVLAERLCSDKVSIGQVAVIDCFTWMLCQVPLRSSVPGISHQLDRATQMVSMNGRSRRNRKTGTFIIFYLTSTISHPTNAAGISAKTMPGKSIPLLAFANSYAKK